MNSPAPFPHEQFPAHVQGLDAGAPCERGAACQSLSHAENISPFSAMVCENHYPSPSSSRSQALASGPGPFFATSTGSSDKGLRFSLGKKANSGKIAANNKTNRGSKRCSSAKSLRGRLPLRCWRDASGMTFTAPDLARQPVPSLRKQPAATFLQARSSARVRVRFAMMSACASVTDFTAATCGVSPDHQPAGQRSGGLFHANSRGGSAHRALT